jgi:preprotein translocase subunit SecD
MKAAAFERLIRSIRQAGRIRRVGLALVICGLVAVLAAAEVEKRDAGFYLVLAEATSAAELPSPTSGQQVVRYDYKFLRESERAEPARYLLLARKADVPLVLARAPTLREKGENGLPELWLELSPEATRNLETLSREHLGQSVAFVIDGEPVTMHKIRSVITGGQFRLSRCTDRACQYLYGRLTSKP